MSKLGTSPIELYDEPERDMDIVAVTERVKELIVKTVSTPDKQFKAAQVFFAWMGIHTLGFTIVSDSKQFDPVYSGAIQGVSTAWHYTFGPMVKASDGRVSGFRILGETTLDTRDVGALYAYLHAKELKDRLKL